ncbi:hypothetical protein ACJMK2_033415 [Sinanodonta woodiana]|uniref:Uncharacterized protein n=1 Tax=Sinanodonta woodiana TaxID=1069815 RepID=A0ABD3WNB6_SINWO
MPQLFVLYRSTYDDSFLSKREYWLHKYSEEKTKKRMEWLLDNPDELVHVILSFLNTHLQQTRKEYLHIIDMENQLSFPSPGGVMLQVTDEDPDCRLMLLDKIIIPHGDLSVSFKSLCHMYGTECFIFSITKKIV